MNMRVLLVRWAEVILHFTKSVKIKRIGTLCAEHHHVTADESVFHLNFHSIIRSLEKFRSIVAVMVISMWNYCSCNCFMESRYVRLRLLRICHGDFKCVWNWVVLLPKHCPLIVPSWWKYLLVCFPIVVLDIVLRGWLIAEHDHLMCKAWVHGGMNEVLNVVNKHAIILLLLHCGKFRSQFMRNGIKILWCLVINSIASRGIPLSNEAEGIAWIITKKVTSQWGIMFVTAYEWSQEVATR